jgi:AraC-like DNA-binding protein
MLALKLERTVFFLQSFHSGKWGNFVKKGKDISSQFSGLYLVHQNLPGKRNASVLYPEPILFIPLQGEIAVQVEDRTITLSLGQMLYLPPHTQHSFTSSNQMGERLIAMLDPKLAPKGLEAAVPIKLPLHQFMKELLFYLLLHPKTKSAKSLVQIFAETLSEAIAESASAVLSLQEHLESKSSDPRVLQSLGYLQNHLNEDLNMAGVAKKAGLSLRNFNRLMVKETGLQPKRWLVSYRIAKAKELLRVPGTSVTEVAYAVGYNSLGPFISAFRASTGQLPSEYLRRG